MIRTFAIATIAALGLSAPAFAADTASDASQATAAAVTAQLTNDRAAEQVRNQLAAQGYTSISELERADDGRWTGSAVKDGKQVIVGVKMPPHQTTAN